MNGKFKIERLPAFQLKSENEIKKWFLPVIQFWFQRWFTILMSCLQYHHLTRAHTKIKREKNEKQKYEN